MQTNMNYDSKKNVRLLKNVFNKRSIKNSKAINKKGKN